MFEVIGLIGLLLLIIPSSIFFLLYIIFYRYGRRYKSPIDEVIYYSEPVSVIIPVRKEPPELIDNAFESLSLWRNTRLEIILVSDDSPKDFNEVKKIVDVWRSKGLNIVLLWRWKPRGFRSGALNDALRASTGRYIYVMDVDSRLNESFIHKAIQLIKRGVVAVVARWTGKNTDTRVAEAVAASMKYIVDSLYKGRSALNLPVFPVGTGTVYDALYLKNVLKGWDEERIQDDMDIGARIMHRGGRILFIDDEPVYVEVPRKYKSLRVQQERWSYGASDVAIARFREIITSPQPWYAKLEAFYFLLQYFLTTLSLMGFILISFSALTTNSDVFGEYWWLGSIWIITAALYSYYYIESLREIGYSTWRSIVNLGRSAAITVALTPTLSASILRAFLRRPFIYKRTPKGIHESILSGLRIPWELLFGLSISLIGLYEILHGLTYTGLWSITYSLGYIYVCIRFFKDVIYK